MNIPSMDFQGILIRAEDRRGGLANTNWRVGDGKVGGLDIRFAAAHISRLDRLAEGFAKKAEQAGLRIPKEGSGRELALKNAEELGLLAQAAAATASAWRTVIDRAHDELKQQVAETGSREARAALAEAGKVTYRDRLKKRRAAEAKENAEKRLVLRAEQQAAANASADVRAGADERRAAIERRRAARAAQQG